MRGKRVHKNSIPFLFLLQRGKRVSVIEKVPFATEGAKNDMPGHSVGVGGG